MPKQTKITVGWREWTSLPDLNIPHIKAKIDTGARTSALHAYRVIPYKRNNQQRVKFYLHPYQNNLRVSVECDAKVVDYRSVTDSGGHREKRYVIVTTLQLGEQDWEIEMTLTNRETMKFRMLLGRTAMKDKILVNPARSYLASVPPKKKHKRHR